MAIVILNNKDIVTRKTEEQIRKSVVLETRTYFQLYPFDSIPPYLYEVIKAHKPEKCYSITAGKVSQ